MQRDMMGGIPQAGLFLLLALAAIFIYGLGYWYMAAPIAVLYCVMRVMTARDQWMIDIIIENIHQRDIYLP
jgi:type IV secretory pathway VirB3-like protein